MTDRNLTAVICALVVMALAAIATIGCASKPLPHSPWILGSTDPKVFPKVTTFGPDRKSACWNPGWCNTTTCTTYPGQYPSCVETLLGCGRPPECDK